MTHLARGESTRACGASHPQNPPEPSPMGPEWLSGTWPVWKAAGAEPAPEDTAHLPATVSGRVFQGGCMVSSSLYVRSADMCVSF